MVARAVTVSAPALTGRQLIDEAQAFSQEAWSFIFDQHYEKIYRYCYLRTGNVAVAEDLASDVFLEALRGIRRYEYRGSPISAWLYRIAHNLTADFLNRANRRPTTALPEQEGDHAELRTEDQSDAVDLRQDVRTALQQLKKDHQQVILLRFFAGLTHEETAAIMGREPGAVRVLQSRALSALRRVMAA